jgi:hypothetical protein
MVDIRIYQVTRNSLDATSRQRESMGMPCPLHPSTILSKPHPSYIPKIPLDKSPFGGIFFDW